MKVSFSFSCETGKARCSALYFIRSQVNQSYILLWKVLRAALRILLRINGLNLPMKKVSHIKKIQFSVGFIVLVLFR